MKRYMCLFILLMISRYALAQHVYSIRADTVRIYNTCDTAELVLENRTKDTLGFLFNKGNGRTEFRRMRFSNFGAGRFAIIGQDTIDLGNTFIRNQNPLSAAQTANLWISGEAKANTAVATPVVYGNVSDNALMLIGGATTSSSYRGGQVTLYGGINPSLPSRGTITFSTGTGGGGGVQPERMRIDTNGNIGIGTSVPTNRLHVANSTSLVASQVNTYAVRVSQNGGDLSLGNDANYSYLQSFGGKPLKINDQGNPILFLTNSTSGIGIGNITNPLGSLHIVTPNGINAAYFQSTGAYNNLSGAFLRLYNSGTPTAADQRLGGILWGSLNGSTSRTGAQIDALSESAWTDGTSHPTYLRFMTTASGGGTSVERVRITSAGNIGVGTTSPAATLHVVGTARISGATDIGNASFVRGGSSGVANSSYLQFMENDGVTRKGYVGDGELITDDIYLSANIGNIRLVPVGGNSGSAIVQGTNFGFNGGQISLTNSTSNLLFFSGAGAAPPAFTTRSLGTKILLTGALTGSLTDYAVGIESNNIWNSVPQNNTVYGFKWYGGTTQIARLDGAGALTLSGQLQATSVVQTSLRSLKKDIQPFTQSALTILSKAQVRTFQFKADPDARTNIGFIADEVPDEMAPPKRNGVDQSNTVALLVKAVQELAAQNKALQQELEAVKQQLKNKGVQ